MTVGIWITSVQLFRWRSYIYLAINKYINTPIDTPFLAGYLLSLLIKDNVFHTDFMLVHLQMSFDIDDKKVLH